MQDFFGGHTTLKGWHNLETLIKEYGLPRDYIVGKKCRAVDESDGWGDLEGGEEGYIVEINPNYAVAVFYDDYHWDGRYWCFEVWMSDEEDIL